MSFFGVDDLGIDDLENLQQGRRRYHNLTRCIIDGGKVTLNYPQRVKYAERHRAQFCYLVEKRGYWRWKILETRCSTTAVFGVSVKFGRNIGLVIQIN